jgi:hypothetical protein
MKRLVLVLGLSLTASQVSHQSISLALANPPEKK